MAPGFAHPSTPGRSILCRLERSPHVPDEGPTSPDSTILPIVESQRNRLRERNRELEENLLALRQQVVVVQTELESVRLDNVKLYEKIKFVQSYSPSPQKPRLDKTSITISPSPSFPVPRSGDEVLEKYSHAYAERLNPFEQFGRDERNRRYQSLLPHEKLMLIMGRIVMNNREARLCAFAYAFGLHFLVFFVLWMMVHTTNPLCPDAQNID